MLNDNLIDICKISYYKAFTSCNEYRDESSTWYIKPLGEVLDRVAMGPFGSNIKAECFVSSGNPVLSGENLSSIFLTENSFRYVDDEKADELKNCTASHGDIVITHRGTLGQVTMIPYKTKFNKYIISQSQFMFSCNTKYILPEYALFYFHTDIGSRKLLSNDNTTGVPSIAKPTSHIRNLHIPIPPIEIQKKWTKLVRESMDKITLNNAEIDRLIFLSKLLLTQLSR